MSVMHRGDDGKSIAGIRHMQVGDQHVEFFSHNIFQRFVDGGSRYDLKPLAFQT